MPRSLSPRALDAALAALLVGALLIGLVAVASRPTSAPAGEARALFAARCGRCHAVRGLSAGGAGPALDGFGSAAWATAMMTHPDDDRLMGRTPIRRMRPQLAELADEGDGALADVAVYLEAQGREPGDPAPDRLRVARGSGIYHRRCTRCHQGSGDNSGTPRDDREDPDLDGWGSRRWIRAMVLDPTAYELYNRRDHMGRFADALTPREVDLLVDLVRSLRATAAPVVAPSPAPSPTTPRPAALRGATLGPIEHHLRPGAGYGTAASARALDELRALGCTWVSVTPFGRVWDLQSTAIKPDFEAPRAASEAGVRAVIAQAHARGLRVLLVPHLWVETTGWRGEIGARDAANERPDAFTEAEWAAFFASYAGFVAGWARVAEEGGAEMLSVGVELKSSSGSRPEWFAVIDATRAVYRGALTYSANWDEVERVAFWHRLDVVGVQGFYALAMRRGATLDEQRREATRRADRLEAWARREGRAVLFTEFGYTATRDAALEPWAWPDGMARPAVDARAQADGYRALLEAFAGRPWFAGAFVWRYYADPMDASQEEPWGFSPRGREGEAVLRDLYDPRLAWGADPPAPPAL
jgi:cytochrome c553/nicotinamidase-related amidase